MNTHVQLMQRAFPLRVPCSHTLAAIAFLHALGLPARDVLDFFDRAYLLTTISAMQDGFELSAPAASDLDRDTSVLPPPQHSQGNRERHPSAAAWFSRRCPGTWCGSGLSMHVDAFTAKCTAPDSEARPRPNHRMPRLTATPTMAKVKLEATTVVPSRYVVGNSPFYAVFAEHEDEQSEQGRDFEDSEY